jgi:EmrB/QacA subfamily drug resistance transporter
MLQIDDEKRKWWILAAMGGSLGLILLDETVVGVALPSIRHDLALSEVHAHWVINAYLLVLAAFAAAGGKLGDVIGMKVLFVGGVLLFGLSSLAAGSAESGTWLIAARAMQGIGAAVVFPGSMAMLTVVFPEQQRGMALGIYGAIGTVFLTMGPFVGGLFTELLSWRWIFWVNLPLVAAVALVVLFAWIDPPRQVASTRFDYAGTGTLAGGLFLLVFGVMEGPEWGWNHAVIWLSLVAAGAILTIFVVVEARRSAPLIEIGLFRQASFTASNLVVLLAQFTKMAVIVIGALYLQSALGMSPLAAGTALLAAVVPEPFTAPPSGRLADRFGARKPTLVALALTLIALLWIAVAVSWNSYLLLLPGLVVWGIAQPGLFTPPTRAVMNAVPVDKEGQASGILMTAQLLGGTVGMAVLSALLTTTHSYQVVFLATTALTGVVLAIGWFAIERPHPAAAAAP